MRREGGRGEATVQSRSAAHPPLTACVRRRRAVAEAGEAAGEAGRRGKRERKVVASVRAALKCEPAGKS